MKKIWKITRGFIIIIASIVITSLAINATDHIGNISESLLGNVFSIGGNSDGCGEGMAAVPAEGGSFCIDKYEASPSNGCQYKDPKNTEETKLNLDQPDCKAASVSGVSPWRNIARHQAELACAKAGKRLPTNKEWYRASLGTPDISSGWGADDCNLGRKNVQEPDMTESHQRCISSVGAYDMAGNVWEWVDGSINDGEYLGRNIPPSGFVQEIDIDGIAVKTDLQSPEISFNEDYFWSDGAGIKGIIRGGYWGNDSDAGQYAVNSVVSPMFTGMGVGFRCAK